MSCSSEEQQKVDDLNNANLSRPTSYSITKKYSLVLDRNNKEVAELNEENAYLYENNEDVHIEEIEILFTAINLSEYFENDIQFLNYVQSNPLDIDGNIEVYTNGVLVYGIGIEKGRDLNVYMGETSSSEDCKDSEGNYTCSYKCIKQCAIDGIHAQNWLQMIECISEGFGCVTKWYAYCIIDNC